MEITPRHWLIAVVIAGLAHAALALALIMQRSTPLPAASRDISIVLGDGGEGSAAGSPTGADALRPVASPSLAIKPANAPAPVDVSSLVSEVDPQASERARTISPAQTLVAKARPEPTPEPTPEPRQSTGRSKPSDPGTEPKHPPAVPQEAANTSANADAGQAPRARHVSPAASADGSSTVSNDASKPGQNRDRPGNGDGGRAAGKTAGAGGSGCGSSLSLYKGRLATWLARHERYPTQARRLRQEGTVQVTITVDHNGRVISKRIIQSSGHELLDREAQAMLERASPLPRLPACLGGSSLTITLPVDFDLR